MFTEKFGVTPFTGSKTKAEIWDYSDIDINGFYCPAYALTWQESGL